MRLYLKQKISPSLTEYLSQIEMFYTPKEINPTQDQFSLEISYQILKYLEEEMTE